MTELRVMDVVRHLIPKLFAAYLVIATLATVAFFIAVTAYARPLVALYLLLGALAGLSARRLLLIASQHHVFQRARATLSHPTMSWR
jgi:hypothetical protein